MSIMCSEYFLAAASHTQQIHIIQHKFLIALVFGSGLKGFVLWLFEVVKRWAFISEYIRIEYIQDICVCTLRRCINQTSECDCAVKLLSGKLWGLIRLWVLEIFFITILNPVDRVQKLIFKTQKKKRKFYDRWFWCCCWRVGDNFKCQTPQNIHMN